MGIIAKLNNFIDNSIHVLHVSYKPSPGEYNRSAKVILLGILLIGALGFIISIIVGFITGSSL